MPAKPADDLTGLLEARRREGLFPSYQALVVEGTRTLFEAAAGDAVIEPEVHPATLETLYDLASLTKPLVTAMLTMRLVEEGVIALEIPASRWLDLLTDAPFDQITPLELLCHRSGLAAWAPLYLDARPALADTARVALAQPLGCEPGTDVIYSDLGYIVLGALIERATGRPFAEIARRHVTELAGADGIGFVTRDRRAEVAATERGNRYECRLAGASEDDDRFRSHMLWGEVHDGNAAALGGIAPHAGLFGTARAVARLAAHWIDPAGRLGPASRALARADLTASSPTHRSVAFELASSEGCAASGVLPGDAIGHVGFTGTSLWIEPDRGRIYVLLTNRVHPSVQPVNMNAVRREFHAAARRL